MGRKINYAEKPKKGPGRKSRKQKDPVFDKQLLKDSEELVKLSHRQKNRARKREQLKLKKQESKIKTKAQSKKPKKAAKQKQKYTSDDEEQSEEENKVQNLLPVKMDFQKSREKYAKVTGKNNKPLPAVTSNDGDDDSANSDSSNDDQTSHKRNRDILESDDDDDNSDGDSDASEPQAKMGKLKDFMNSDDDDSDDSEDDDEDEDVDSDQESMLPIERAGKKLKRKMQKDEQLAEEELKDIVANKEKFEFPDNEQAAPTNLQDIHMRIKEVIGVLADFSVNRDPNRSRAEYMELLLKDLCVYYSYNEFFMQLLMKLFSPNELLEFLEASEVQRPLSIRTNSLKTRRRDLAQALINRGVNLDPVGKWSKEGLVVYTSTVPLGATPEYLAGHYMIQGASSMLPVMALAPEENERILDLCSAPGGKSSHIAALMKNTGVLFANDVNKDRLQAVVGNFHRLGIQNAIVTSIDGTKYRDVMTGFDRVLLDAPCTGSGVISKDPSVKTTKTEVDIQRCYNLQRKLLLTAIDCLSANSETGGFLVYSTCSILPQENEWVIDYALRKRNVRLVSTGLDFGNEGFVNFAGQKYHPSMKLTRRFYPHTYNMDGFFVAKLQKFSDAIPSGKQDEEDNESIAEEQEEEVVQELPKKIDKRDWYYKDIIDKRKKQREDPNHVVKVFEKPSKSSKIPPPVAIPTPKVKNGDKSIRSAIKKASAKKLKKKRQSMPEAGLSSNGTEYVESSDQVLTTPKKVKKRLSLPGSLGMRKVKK